jgi:hypothetical protein
LVLFKEEILLNEVPFIDLRAKAQTKEAAESSAASSLLKL